MKNLAKLNGANALSKNEQKSINGGGQDCGFIYNSIELYCEDLVSPQTSFNTCCKAHNSCLFSTGCDGPAKE